jgi:hypothetical protein
VEHCGQVPETPWRWPELWRANRDQIKNPHWIYPGDVVVLTRGADGQPQLSLDQTTRLSPTVRVEPLEAQAILSIPAADIEPYLSRPLITGPEGLPGAGRIVAGRDSRVVRGQGDTVYAINIDERSGGRWFLYRPGRVFPLRQQRDPRLRDAVPGNRCGSIAMPRSAPW